MTARNFRPWPAVDRDQYDQMLCPIPRCDEPLYLIRTYSIPLIAEQDTDLGPDDATTNTWAVECINGHRLHDAIDQARHEGTDETADYALEYDHFLTHQRVNELGGERL